MTCGVPHGSILGPLLFLLLINDIGSASNGLSTLMFADDTSMLGHDKKYQLSPVMYQWESANGI